MMSERSRDGEGTVVYVGGLLTDVTKEDLESQFEKYGKLLRVWVAFNPPGFAFVEFLNKVDAEAAVDAMHDATVLGSKLRVEISRGRGRGGRGGRGGDRGGRGGFRGDRDGRDSDFGRSRGGFGGGRPTPYGRDNDLKSFRGSGEMGSRFNDFEGRRRSEYDDRDFGFGARRGGARDFGDLDSPRFGGSRDYRDMDTPRGFGDRDIGGRDFPSRGRDFTPRDIGGGDFSSRDIGGIPPRDMEDRDFPPRHFSRDLENGRDLRDFGIERGVNGMRGFGGNSRDALFGGGRDVSNNRDLGISQSTIPERDYGASGHDIGGGRGYGGRDVDDLREFGGTRDIGMRREGVRDFNPPRDLGDPRDFGGRSARGMDADRFGGVGGRAVQRPGGGRFPGGDIGGGSGNFDDYGARDRFRSRSPIGRGSRPIY